MRKAVLFLLLLLPVFLFSSCQGSIPGGSRQLTAFTVIAIVIVLFLALAAFSNMLRDEVSNCHEFDANAQKMQQQQKTKISRKPPFSLTRVQLGLWTVIIACSYVYLSFYKGDCAESSVNKTALVLAVIFSITVAGSSIIDKREISDNRSRHQNTPSHGFFIDILSDDNGISLHRFQHFVWTLIAIAVYLYKLSLVTTGCLLPELSDTLLALTGISSATYLMLRAGENDPPEKDTAEDSIKPEVDTGDTKYNRRDPGFYG